MEVLGPQDLIHFQINVFSFSLYEYFNNIQLRF
jgi:hypothetical protein